jgi:hypothetical protein
MVDLDAGNHCHLADELAGPSSALMLDRQRNVLQQPFTNVSISMLSFHIVGPPSSRSLNSKTAGLHDMHNALKRVVDHLRGLAKPGRNRHSTMLDTPARGPRAQQ